MKLHLPYRLYRALLVALAAVPTWIYATPAATVPEGDTAHNVSTVEDVTPYAESGKQAFLLEQNLIFDGSPTFSASKFFTSADSENLVSLTFQNYNGKHVWGGETGYSLTLQGLSVITVRNSRSYSDGGAIYNDNGTFTLSGNGSVTFSGNSSSSTSSGGAIYNGGTFSINSNGSVSFTDNSSGIYSGGRLDIANNDTVIFRGNERGDLTFSAETTSSQLTLSARPGGRIEFNNPVSITKWDTVSGFQVSYNQMFEDEQGKHAQTGILFLLGKTPVYWR